MLFHGPPRNSSSRMLILYCSVYATFSLIMATMASWFFVDWRARYGEAQWPLLVFAVAFGACGIFLLHVARKESQR